MSVTGSASAGGQFALMDDVTNSTTGIRSLSTLSKEESVMLKFKNFGRKSLTELQEKLGELNLSFGMDIAQYLDA